jgi:DNA gyrase subunit B
MATSKTAAQKPVAKKSGSGTYDDKSIKTLAFPESVRKNPSMYIGGTDAHGLFVILREPCDNFVDEFLAGRNNFGAIKIDSDGSYWVQDGGAGIPQGIAKGEINVNGKIVKTLTPTMQNIFGTLHTSGKFESEAYAVSIGSHGVGVKGTNATSEFFDVVSCYKGKWYKIGFKKGKLTTPVQSCAAPKSPFTGKTMLKGTLIRYKPDATIFSVKSFPPSMLLEWAEVQSYLNPGLRILVDVKGKTKSFESKKGPVEYIEKRLVALKAVGEADMFEFNNELGQAVVSFSNADGLELKGFTNGLANSQGGKHVDSVVSALYEAIKPHIGAMRKDEKPFTARDFSDGMVGIVNAKLHKASFSSQDKAKLVDDRMGAGFKDMVLPVAKKFFSANKAMAKRLVERAKKISALKNKFKASKALTTELNGLKRNGLPANYAPARAGTPIHERELFIVEGDSAAGGFRKVRANHQALLPLSGKIKNAVRAKGDAALLSKAVLNILAAIGFDPKQAEPLKKLQIGKIIFLADADPDGSHINCLLLGLISKYLPEMFEQGMVYVADMPEFYAIKGTHLFTGDTLSEVNAKAEKAGVKVDVQHAKGWGEVDPQVLKILAVDGSRRLIKINPLSAEDTRIFHGLMGQVDDNGGGTAASEKPEPAAKLAVKKVPARKTAAAKKVPARKTTRKVTK